MKFSEKMVLIFVCFASIHFCTRSTAFGCKYTVRDIGFTDLGSSPYKLYLLIDEKTPTEVAVSFQRIAFASLLEANIESETVNVNLQTQHLATRWFLSKVEKPLPAIVLADSEKMIQLPFSATNKNINESMWQSIEIAVASPIRQKIIDIVSRMYGVVLLIEGAESEKNRLALQSIKSAIKDISEVLTIMPKPIKEGPQIIVLPHDDVQNQKVLLWSVGADVEEFKEPQVAVLFGRGRRIGPVLKADQLSPENIFSLLSIIGADCECGLDRSVMLGKMMPMRWEKQVQSDLVAELGFDVENPMIKAEMSQILSIDASSGGEPKTSNPLTAYVEGIVRFDSQASAPRVSSNQFRNSGSSGLTILHFGLMAAAGLIVFVLTVAGVVYIRAKNQQG